MIKIFRKSWSIFSTKSYTSKHHTIINQFSSMSNTKEMFYINSQIVQTQDPANPEKVIKTYPLTIEKTIIPELKPDEYLMKVAALGINRAEIIQKKGFYPPPPGASTILGLEAVGRIVDPETLEPINILTTTNTSNDQAPLFGAIVGGGSYAQYMAVKKANLLQMPENLTLEQNAAIPEAWFTAFQLLWEVAKIQEGDWVYIPAAASGVGLAAIQLVKQCFGGRVIASCGSEDKKMFCEQFGPDYVINYKDPAMTPEKIQEVILEKTGGKGISVCLDCVGPSSWGLYSNVLAMDARLVVFGYLGGMGCTDTSLLGKLVFKRISILGTNIRTRDVEYKSKVINMFNSLAVPKFQDGTMQPNVHIKYKLDFTNPEHGKIMAEGHRVMEANENIGKIIFEF
jgi:tumor protein p53-inducible protein 3